MNREIAGLNPNGIMDQVSFRIRRAESGDESLLLKIRLEALSESPEAFGSTIDRERARTPADWQKWLSPSATFLLETDTGPQGIVAGVPDATEPALVHSVLAWAQERGASSVRLDVIEDNERARGLYEKHGFRATGHINVRPRDGARELQMERRVSADSECSGG